MTPPPDRKDDIRLHKIESSKYDHKVLIAVPSYDPENPAREVGAGWFMGDVRGISISVTDVPDLRELADVLLEAADQLEGR